MATRKKAAKSESESIPAAEAKPKRGSVECTACHEMVERSPRFRPAKAGEPASCDICGKGRLAVITEGRAARNVTRG